LGQVEFVREIASRASTEVRHRTQLRLGGFLNNYLRHRQVPGFADTAKSLSLGAIMVTTGAKAPLNALPAEVDVPSEVLECANAS
jgi:hypothetical protein